jgi:hypothetical protein
VSTGGARTTIGASVQGATPTAANAMGWSITYESAHLSLDAVRWSEGNPVFEARALPRAPTPNPLRFSWGTAYAHPGHYTPGQALADVSVLRVIDLLGPPVDLGTVIAVTGTANSATMGLRPADAARVSGTPLRAGTTARAQGTASKAGVTVRFRVEITESIDIDGAAAHGVILADGTTRYALTVDLGAWLDRADFGALAGVAAGADGVVDVPAEHQVRNAFFRGVSNGAAYRFVVVTPAR